MEYRFFVEGALVGFSIAAPIGPVGICIIRKTLQFGRLSGYAAAFGATVGAALFAIIAIFGISFASNFLIGKSFWLRLIGGAILVYLGFRTFFSHPVGERNGVWCKTLVSDCMTTFLLNLTNPMTILPYLAVFAGFGFAESMHTTSIKTLVTLGTVVGSIIWWVILIEGVSCFRRKITENVMFWINRVAGSIIIAFGLISWVTLL